jgi:hypothetical protein
VFVSLAGLTCVVPDVGVGAPCGEQSDCTTDNVCVRIDPEDDNEGSVCLPMLELDAPFPCAADEDCAAAGFPIDSSCDGDGRCTCDDAAFTCGDFDQVVGEHTCRCLDTVVNTGDECEDDNQCVSQHCGNGSCTDGVDGDDCDADDDCPLSLESRCADGACV